MDVSSEDQSVRSERVEAAARIPPFSPGTVTAMAGEVERLMANGLFSCWAADQKRVWLDRSSSHANPQH